MFYTWGKKLSLKRKLSSPTPPSSKKLKRGAFFIVKHNALDHSTTNVRTAPTLESFRPPFSKGGEGLGRVAPSLSSLKRRSL